MLQLDTNALTVYHLLPNGDWIELVPYKETSIINPNGPNTLGIVALGPNFTFFINDQEVAETVDDSIPAGTFGLFLETFEPEGEATVVFDSLEVYGLTEE